MKPTTIDNQKYLAPSWEEMGKLCFQLAKDILKMNVKIDRIIALAKGGLTWSRTMADYLTIDKVSVTHIRFYTDIALTDKQPVIVQSLPVTVEGERVLLFDDVADSGETLKAAKEYLRWCGAKKVMAATLFTKSWAKVKPDFTGATTDAWIIFPHEIREMIGLISDKWKKTATKQEIVNRFLKIGLPKEQVEYFLAKARS